MQKIFPNYYNSFKCIASDCKHSCCVGWEISIDAKSLKKYAKIKGELGEKLKNSIDKKQSSFVLDKNKRCPFLDDNNLCELIIAGGDKNLCYICTHHPRFYNFLNGRTEMGLGLSCEEVCRIVLSQKEAVKFITQGEGNRLTKKQQKIIDLRDKVISTFQDRSLSVNQRIQTVKKEYGIKLKGKTVKGWARFLSNLEILDNEWLNTLKLLKTPTKKQQILTLYNAKPNLQIELEQFIVYLCYRHLATSYNEEEFLDRLSFVVLCAELMQIIITASFNLSNECDFNKRIDLIRSFSSEIEYSEQNLNDVIDEITILRGIYEHT